MQIDYNTIAKAAKVLRAVNHRLRQQLIKLIGEEKKITVTDIYVRILLEQSVVSQHLAILRKAGVVKTDREGKFILYSLDEARLKFIEEKSIELTK